jgi:hypothetical protein
VIPNLSLKFVSSLFIEKLLFPDLDCPFLGGAFLFVAPDSLLSVSD